ncbi:MAG TPA: hypothetical protein VFT34_14280 [Verrucomicrobiae bacterium]|nr:hypothetical protein [Verrucomicrobiae bacterium]
MATLQNDTGEDQSELAVSYDLRVANQPWVTIAEEVPGLRAYFSLSGSPASWQLIPESTSGAPGPLWARLELGFWPAGAQLFLLWADDNSFANADNTGTEEGAYAIDDFNAYVDNIIFDPLSGVAIYRPISGESFPEGASILFSMYSTPGLGSITNVVLYDGTNVIGTATRFCTFVSIRKRRRRCALPAYQSIRSCPPQPGPLLPRREERERADWVLGQCQDASLVVVDQRASISTGRNCSHTG